MTSDTTRSWVNPVMGAVSVLAIGAGLWTAFTSAPDSEQGNFVRILYIHVPSAWLAFLAFGVTALGSAGWLIRKKLRWDRLAEASAELGVLFTAIALFTGALWGKPVWGKYWDWGDARMASTALMFFVYLGYLALRRATPDPTQRARRSAVLGLVAVVQVPLVYFSVTLWRTLHQPFTIRPDGIQMDSSMVVALLTNLAAFTILYVALLVARYRLPGEVAGTATVPAGAAVTAPNLRSEP
ncbi:MAG: cytochrome c biogenesis protein [Acidimicrobiia bacterium]|nr:cytochrome c biogenesis protein [Acidimicrobiia bacterium]MDH4308358.1 cytochrome c biogenesis protein [Acidimicrobiia bacterium]MDH5293983.1 cytochrome c biogenesis protein [Acidimicrobiia bacterium]